MRYFTRKQTSMKTIKYEDIKTATTVAEFRENLKKYFNIKGHKFLFCLWIKTKMIIIPRRAHRSVGTLLVNVILTSIHFPSWIMRYIMIAI